jgi:hypothetical protein
LNALSRRNFVKGARLGTAKAAYDAAGIAGRQRAQVVAQPGGLIEAWDKAKQAAATTITRAIFRNRPRLN